MDPLDLIPFALGFGISAVLMGFFEQWRRHVLEESVRELRERTNILAAKLRHWSNDDPR